MPCRTEYPDEQPEYMRRQIAFLKAALCAVLTSARTVSVSELVLDSIDEKEAGVTSPEIRRWWATHQEEDALRKKAEREYEEMKKVRDRGREAALSKLTEEDRKWLNLG